MPRTLHVSREVSRTLDVADRRRWAARARIRAESEPAAAVFSAYLEHLRLRGRGNTAYTEAARSFLRRWPHVQDWADIALHRQLAANSSTRPFVTFLMVTGRLRPGYDYLLARKLSSLRHDLTASPLEPDLIRFISAAIELGFTLRIALGWRLLPLRTFGPRLQQLRQVGEQLRGLAARNTTGSNTAGYQ